VQRYAKTKVFKKNILSLQQISENGVYIQVGTM